jgi:hypothetical protein
VSSELGWWTISGEALLEAMERAHAGESPTLVYAELYANSEPTLIEEFDDEDET